MATAEFVWMLTDPCSGASFAPASPILYTITDLEIVEMFPPIIVTLAYCNDLVVYDLEAEPLNSFIRNAISFRELGEIKIKETRSLRVLGDQNPGYPQSNTYTLIYKAIVGRGDTSV